MKANIAAYYDQTQNHYKRWWQLDQSMALHYGLWYKDTNSFSEALNNTNDYMASQASISSKCSILDAGCGVGGAAIFLAKAFSAHVVGITLSELQLKTARANALKHMVNEKIEFKLIDFANTSFGSESFDVIWACESSSSVSDKSKMVKEWYRLLRPGGRLILLDFFRQDQIDDKTARWLTKWSDLWAMSELITVDQLKTIMATNGFGKIKCQDLTKRVVPTIRRMYFSYWIGLLPAVLYNSFYQARRYARNHYKSGLYQYKSFKQKGWKYYSLMAVKSD